MVDVTAAAVATIAAAATLVLTRSTFRPFPPGTKVPPVAGNGLCLLPWLRQHVHNILYVEEAGAAYLRWSRELGQTCFGINIFRSQRMVVTDPEDLRYVLIDRPVNFDKNSIMYIITERVVTPGLLTIADESEHARQRRLINPAFGPIPLRAITNGTVRTHAMAFVESLRQQLRATGDRNHGMSPTLDVTLNDAICALTLQIIADAAFLCSKEDLAVVSEHFLTMMSNGFTPLRFLPFATRIPFFRKLRAAEASKLRIREFVNELITRRKRDDDCKAEGESAAVSASSRSRALVDLLLREGELSPKDVVQNSITFLFAGHETTSNTLQFLLAELARHPDTQEKLAEELASMMGVGACPTIEVLERCVFLDCVIKEALRLYPAAPVIGRNVVHDDVLPGSRVFVPKGMSLVLSIFAAQRDPGLYGADADEFRPERWEDGRLEARLPPCAFLPFGAGKRNCVGKDLAMNELRVIVAALVRAFRFELAPGEAFPRRKYVLTLRTEHPYKLRVTEREA